MEDMMQKWWCEGTTSTFGKSNKIYQRNVSRTFQNSTIWACWEKAIHFFIRLDSSRSHFQDCVMEPTRIFWTLIERLQVLSSFQQLIRPKLPWYSTGLEFSPSGSNFPKWLIINFVSHNSQRNLYVIMNHRRSDYWTFIWHFRCPLWCPVISLHSA